jgi:hypothetical protein
MLPPRGAFSVGPSVQPIEDKVAIAKLLNVSEEDAAKLLRLDPETDEQPAERGAPPKRAKRHHSI